MEKGWGCKKNNHFLNLSQWYIYASLMYIHSKQIPHFKKKSTFIHWHLKMGLPYKFYVLGQIGLSKQCRPRSDCFWRSSLIRVYTVCHSISIFWMHYCNVTSNFSIFRTIMAIVWGVPNFRIFTVPNCSQLLRFPYRCSYASLVGIRSKAVYEVY